MLVDAPADSGSSLGGRRAHALGQSTRDTILSTAERLFAERGIDRVSLRQIGIAAGQQNTAAVKYHFGDKDGLLRAIFDMRLKCINPVRTALLDTLEREERLTDPRGLIEAFAMPLAGELDGSTNYVQLLAQVQLHPYRGHPFNLADPELRSSASRVFELLQEVVPLEYPEDRRRRVALTTGFVVSALATRSAVVAVSPERASGYIAEVIDLAAAMLVAPKTAR
jgi:AcrR family transcriptional regulator